MVGIIGKGGIVGIRTITWIAEEKTCPPKHSAIAKMYLIRVRVTVLGGWS